MLGKIKKALGIEGVKVTLQTEPIHSLKTGSIPGSLRFTTQSDSKVKSFTIKLVERYSRGRGKNKRTDEYEMGKYESTKVFTITKEEIIEIPFDLKYHRFQSEMDRIQRANFLTVGIIALAKKLKGVQSEFIISVQADVQGTKLDPFDKMELVFE